MRLSCADKLPPTYLDTCDKCRAQREQLNKRHLFINGKPKVNIPNSLNHVGHRVKPGAYDRSAFKKVQPAGATAAATSAQPSHSTLPA